MVRLALEGERGLRARLERGRDWLEIEVFRPAGDERVFARLDHCAVRYRGYVAGSSPEDRAELHALVMGLAEAVDARLAAAGSEDFFEAMGRDPTPRTLRFDGRGLLELLAPDVVAGQPLDGDFRLVDVYPGSHVADRARRHGELVLDFRRGAGEEERLQVAVAPTDPATPAFARSAHFDVAYLTQGDDAEGSALSLVTRVAFLLQVRDGPHLEVSVPASEPSAGLIEAAAAGSEAAAEGEAFNLAINADCDQACAFCSVKAVSAPVGASSTVHERFLADLASNRRRGVRTVRINGYDPLGYPRILEVLDAIRAQGYEQVELFSPCTRLSDPDFCEAVLDRLPADTIFNVPLYGARAQTHDAVVGVQGAFERVTAALGHLDARRGPGSIRVNAVATRDNLGGLAELSRWVRGRGFGLRIQTPYPSSESRDDAFHRSAAPQEAIAEAMAESFEDVESAFVVAGVAPCVVHQAMGRRGIPRSRWILRLWRPPVLPGAEYADSSYRHRASEALHDAFHAATLPCPHAGDCALVEVCPKTILRAYVVSFGDDAFRPVSLLDLLSLEEDARRSAGDVEPPE